MSDIFEDVKQEYSSFNEQTKQELREGYDQFKVQYSPEILETLKGQELLDKIFLGQGKNDNLCYYLEKDKKSVELYGRIGAQNSAQYGLYYNKDTYKSWVKGKGKSTQSLSIQEAIDEGTKIRDLLLDTCKFVKNLKFDTIDDYRKLEEFKNDHQLIKNGWVRKYLHMIFPEHFPTWYNEDMLNAIIRLYGEEPETGLFERVGQVALIAKKCNIPLAVFAKLETNFKVAEAAKGNSDLNKTTRNDGIHYWVCSTGKNGEKWGECYQNGILVLGWDYLGDYAKYKDRIEIEEAIRKQGKTEKPNNDTLAIWEFCHVMKEGDIIYAKKGRTKIVGRGVVKSDYIYDIDRNAYRNVRKVEWQGGDWDLINESFPMKTLTDITKYYDWVEKLENSILRKDSKMQQTKNIPLNQILYGPPGTGKTYNTVVECIRILDRDLYDSYQGSSDKLGFYKDQLLPAYNKFKDQGRIEFITFHQSYSYEEFVEGIKPVLSSEDDQNTSISYFLSDGIFKQICDNARTVQVENIGTKIDFSKIRVFKMSLGGQKDTDISQYCLDNDVIALGWGNSVDFADTKTFDDIEKKYQSATGESDWAPYAVDRFKNLIRKGDIVLIARGTTKFYAIAKVIGDYEYRNDPNITYHHFRKVEWLYKGDDISVSKIYNKNFSQQSIYGFYYPNREGKEDYNGNLRTNIINDIITGKIKNSDEEPYILIIDEINRGNISKIFGELITLIEDDKRSNLSVRLPYSQNPFTVPKNLYIIGTMNTSDRSIAAIDIALRRRFTFIPKMPDISLVPNLFNMKESFEKLNKKIRILLDEDHQIGHSYFMNVKSVVDLKETWANKIIPLLNEYFYGDWNKLNLLIPGFIITDKINNKEIEDEIGENCYYRFNDPYSLSDDDFIKATLGLKLETTAA